jgi:predicted permease
MDRLAQDLRFALRLLGRDRGFTFTTVATLALCLAANIAIFALVNAVLLRPLPFDEPDRLVTMYNAYPGAGVGRGSNGVPDYYDRKRETDVFDDIALYRTSGVTVGGQGQGDAERLQSMPVTPSFFRVLGASPLRGQLFSEADAEPGQDAKVVLSYALWQRRLGGREAALGETLRINGVPHVIVGILPQDFRFVDPDVQLWTAVAFGPEERADDQRHSNNWQLIARLKRAATLEQAQQQIDAINARNLDRFPAFRQILIDAGFHTPVFGFHDELVSTVRPTLLLLWGGVGVLLVIGCVNVANLASVRATGRSRELATRMALGASTGRVARQIVTESLVVSALGGGLGLLAGWASIGTVAYLGFDDLPRGTEISIDGAALAYALGLITLVGVVVALLPIVALTRGSLAQHLRDGRGGTASRAVVAIRRGLVTGQVACALVLLVGAGLLLASFQRVLAVRPGFEPEGVLTANVSLPAARYPAEKDIVSAVNRMLEGLRAIPGVASAGATSTIPFGGAYSDSVILAEGYQVKPGESLISPLYVRVSDGYFETMGTRLVEGRLFDGRDTETSPRTIIIDTRLARKFWPGRSPLGRHLYFPSDANDLLKPPPRDQWYEVVGVVEPVRLASLTSDGESGRFGTYYIPLARSQTRTYTFALRAGARRGTAAATAGTVDPSSLAGALRAAIRTVDPELPVYSLRTMEERVDRALTDRRTPMLLALGFAGVALFLSAIGIYGSLAYQVAQRRREIGVRMALGAATRTIFTMVLREGAVVVAAGAVIGLAGAVAMRRAIETQLYQVGALDPVVIAIVGAVLAAVALVACLVPARSAARTSPVIVLSE